MNLKNKRILILGAGREGKASLRFIQHVAPSATLAIADLETVHLGSDAPETVLMGEQYPNDLSGWDVVIVSPGIPPNHEPLKTAKHITTGTNLFLEHCKGMVIGVTGTKGKSTTSALLHKMVSEEKERVHLVGNIGRPALELLTTNNTPEDTFVFEISSYQTRLLTQAPNMAVVLNLFPDHMDYHGSLEQYYKDKLRIAALLSSEDTLIYNQDDRDVSERVKAAKAQKVPFPDMANVRIQNDELWIKEQNVLKVSEIPLLGEHNALNAVAAATAAHELGISHTAIASAIRHFHSLPHRLEDIGVHRGLQFIDDAISTTPESTIEALKAVLNVGTLILGGTDRGYDFSQLAEEICQLRIPNIVLFPDSGKRIREAMTAAGHEPNVLETTSMESAVRFALEHSERGSVVMLSTASPSYSVFRNYEDKGDQFQNAVEHLA